MYASVSIWLGAFNIVIYLRLFVSANRIFGFRPPKNSQQTINFLNGRYDCSTSSKVLHLRQLHLWFALELGQDRAKTLQALGNNSRCINSLCSLEKLHLDTLQWISVGRPPVVDYL